MFGSVPGSRHGEIVVSDAATGEWRPATHAELEQRRARRAAAPALAANVPVIAPRERLESAMAQARAWSIDPTVPVVVRRKLERSVAAFDQARADRALAPRIAQLKAQLAPKHLTPKQLEAMRERGQRAEWDRQTVAHQERMRNDPAYRDLCSNPLKALGLV